MQRMRKLFADTAIASEIESCLRLNIIDGVTTNPSLLAKSPDKNMIKVYQNIIAMLTHPELNPKKVVIPLSVEAVVEDPDKIVAQARELNDVLKYPGLNFKVPLGNRQNREDAWMELEVIKKISQFMPVNATCIATARQAIMAAEAGASFVSPFFARMRDSGIDPCAVIREIRQELDVRGLHHVQIIAGSIRTPEHCQEAWDAGADIATTSLATIKKASFHPKSNKWVADFLTDYDKWIKA